MIAYSMASMPNNFQPFFSARTRKLLLLAGFLLGAAPSAQAGVEVFTASHIPVSNVPEQATVVELDALAGLDEVLGQGLPADPDQAQRVAEHRMRSAQWQSFAQRYGQAAMAAARAWVLGVEKIPAVVVDGRFVVYGQPDVAAALALIEQGRAAP